MSCTSFEPHVNTCYICDAISVRRFSMKTASRNHIRLTRRFLELATIKRPYKCYSSYVYKDFTQVRNKIHRLHHDHGDETQLHIIIIFFFSPTLPVLLLFNRSFIPENKHGPCVSVLELWSLIYWLKVTYYLLKKIFCYLTQPVKHLTKRLYPGKLRQPHSASKCSNCNGLQYSCEFWQQQAIYCYWTVQTHYPAYHSFNPDGFDGTLSHGLVHSFWRELGWAWFFCLLPFAKIGL